MSSDDQVRKVLDALAGQTFSTLTIAELLDRRRARIRRKRTAFGGVAAAVFAGGVFAVGFTGSDGDTAVTTRTDPSASPGERAPSSGELDLQPTCGPGLPGGLRGPDGAVVTEGPAPGQRPSLPGQTVVHWNAGDDLFEVRWPAEPKALYGHMDAGAENPTTPAPFTGQMSTYFVGQDLVIDLGAAGPDVFFTSGFEEAAPGCDVMEMNARAGQDRGQLGLRLLPGPNPQVETVDLAPWVTSTTDAEAPPQSVAPCSNGTDESNTAATDVESAPQDSPVRALRHFILNSPAAAAFGKSNWSEYALDDETVTYALRSPSSGGAFSVIVQTSRSEAGWIIGSWSSSRC